MRKHDEWWDDTYGSDIDEGRYKLDVDLEQYHGGKTMADIYDEQNATKEATNNMADKLENMTPVELTPAIIP